jgi:N-acetyl-anhydromuramyl-L-alanine amidase AmpD
MSDIVPDCALEARLTEAHGGKRPVTRGIVLHSTRGPTKPAPGEALESVLAREYALAVRYMLDPAHKVSPHFCVGPAKVARMVPDDLIAWHAREHNQTHLGIEVAQPAYCPPFVDWQYEAVAEICARWCRKYGLPPHRVTDVCQPGIIAHSDTAQGRRDGKTDPGCYWDWGRFIPLVERRLIDLERAEANYQTVGEGIRAFLRAHPELGAPHSQYWDKHGNEVVICAGTAAHPHGAWVIWRKWLNSIRVVSWDRPLEV